MALYSHIRCLLCGSHNVVNTKLKFAIFNCRQVANFKEEDSEALNHLTSKLVERRTKKWSQKVQLTRVKVIHNISTYSPPENEFKSAEEINMLLRGAVEVCDNLAITHLTQHCIEHKIFPPLALLLQALSVCSQSGDKDTIIDIVELCEKVNPEILEKNSHFQHYMAEAIWIKGNVAKSLNIFEQVYQENAFLRQRIRLMLKCLISDTIKIRSEATLIILVKFCKALASNYADLYPLVCVWEASFLSEWFSDQSLAMDLIEENSNLLDAIKSRIPYVIHVSLSSHRTEVVYRLTDILLKYDRKSQAAQVFLVLMDYWVKQGALKRCLEIVQWSIQNDVKLPVIHQINFIKLLSEGKSDTVKTKEEQETSDISKRSHANYKF